MFSLLLSKVCLIFGRRISVEESLMRSQIIMNITPSFVEIGALTLPTGRFLTVFLMDAGKDDISTKPKGPDKDELLSASSVTISEQFFALLDIVLAFSIMAILSSVEADRKT